ncbi:transglutaminase domain-containing protein [Luteolibacter ambystomatis]|uniref:Transglutaminase domain-containing protein n=1 Tax=Luteolibacter ambystomatis TaxID=2824561 RepID=A0A975J0S1_9BACT|nr:transglutaminase-like domain-containing protein [Luteolibacter ambystomatis]QUE51913.1 transglutaminase domain-containing protein [Luteolibacter ambystomatis]
MAEASFDDGTTAHDRAKIYEFLDKVETAVGIKEFETVPYERAKHLAESLGNLDRLSLPPRVFLDHLKTVESGKSRFYRQQPLAPEQVDDYLLPMRLRYEHASHQEWMVELAGKFRPLVKEGTGVDEAAVLITRWISDHLKVIGPTRAYRIPVCGDLDPMTVLRGKAGTETDLSIFAVAAFRSLGIPARLTWAPALRNEDGGKVWIEYLRENGEWAAWAPSCGSTCDGGKALRAELNGKLVFVLTNPEAPLDVTGAYAPMVELRFESAQQDTTACILVPGSTGLAPAGGLESDGIKPGHGIRFARGASYLAVTSGGRAFFLSFLDPGKDCKNILVRMENGLPRIEQSP